MSTPSIQTLITQAQQVLNLKSSNEIRATLAAILANANVGTPLNPNLTTQQLWDEFYEIVRQPSDDIMSIITDQMMRMVFSPPAPGGAGADKQVIFNDGGVLAGDTKFLWDKSANQLDVDGPVVITGNLTVDTNVLKVDSTNHRVGIGTATPGETLDISAAAPRIRQTATTGTNGSLLALVNTGGTAYLGLDSAGAGLTAAYALNVYHSGAYPIVFSTNATERARFNSTGNLAFASGLGIDFSAVTGGTGTATANVLNDYEEGTFTPTVIGSTTAGVGVYGVQMGRYTKVGNLVSVQVYISWSAHTGTGNLRFSGLPFNVSADTNYFSAVAFGLVSDLALTAGNILIAYAAGGSTNIDPYQYPTGGGSVTTVPMDGAAAIIYSVTYKV